MNALVLLEATNLARRFGGTQAVENVNLTLRRGEVVGLLGLNGAGKSTTLRILAGVLAPHRGNVRIAGHDLRRTPLKAKRNLGFLPEIPPLYPEMSVDEYLELCAALHGIAGSVRRAAIKEVKIQCGLAAIGARLIRNLSKGMQQRVGIAQAIVHKPAVLILDEPTVGLDPAQLHEMRELIHSLSEARAILLSTHLLNEAESICSRVAVLHRGQIVYDAALHDTKARLLVTLRAPPAIAELEALPGVQKVNAGGGRQFSLQVEDAAGAAEVIAAQAVHAGWGLQQLIPEASALEEIFLQLTREDCHPHGAAAC